MTILDKVYLGKNLWLVKFKYKSDPIAIKIVYLENY